MNVYETGAAPRKPGDPRFNTVRRLPKSRLEQLLAALVISLVLVGAAALIPTAAERLMAFRPSATPMPTPSPTAPPASVLLPDELDRALEGVMTIVNSHTFGTAFLIDPQGEFLTAASLVGGGESLRLVDNSGSMHTVRLVGINPTLGIALVRVTTEGRPLPFGNPAGLLRNDPVVLLANARIQNLPPATPATISNSTDTQLRLQAEDLPGNVGGPVVGPAGKVLGILTASGIALPINLAQPDIAQWHGQSGTLAALAPFPPYLVLRTNATATPLPSSGPAVQGVNPSRVSTGQSTVVTIQGGGFTDGPKLRVRFVPVASPSGGFAGVAPTLVSSSTLTVKVPAGQVVQDYVIQLTNGDGTIVSSGTALTVTP
jgi:trypsin-like peptidase/IPT/TIG domain-containing protein